METLIYPQEILGAWTNSDFDDFVLWCSAIEGLSDVFFISDDYVWLRQFGAWKRCTKKIVTTGSITNILNYISNDSSASSVVLSGKYSDFVYRANIDRFTSKNFRVNATGCYPRGINLVMRLVPSCPPCLQDLDVEQEIIDNCMPNNGLVLVTGVMGSGKSTLLASILRTIRENSTKFIATFEDPVEFDLFNITDEHGRLVETKGPIAQGQIITHLASFAESARNAARRAVDVLLIGESRDTETLRGMIQSAEMGMAVYSTVHTKTVAETFDKIISTFPSNEWNFISSLLINNCKLIIQQRLVPSIEGKRVAIREYLVLSSLHKDLLLNTPINQISSVAKKLVSQDGVTLLMSAKKKYEAGQISLKELRLFEREESNV